MKSELTMPKLRPDMQQGVVVAWLKQPGEPFQKGDAIYEVESDKWSIRLKPSVRKTLPAIGGRRRRRARGRSVAEVE